MNNLLKNEVSIDFNFITQCKVVYKKRNAAKRESPIIQSPSPKLLPFVTSFILFQVGSNNKIRFVAPDWIFMDSHVITGLKHLTHNQPLKLPMFRRPRANII